jgi:hypothetical protein
MTNKQQLLKYQVVAAKTNTQLQLQISFNKFELAQGCKLVLLRMARRRICFHHKPNSRPHVIF